MVVGVAVGDNVSPGCVGDMLGDATGAPVGANVNSNRGAKPFSQ